MVICTAAGTQTLTEHWNGTSWTIVPAINPGSDSDVTAVDATSASNAWAVGQAGEGLDARSLIEHWNGTSWTKSPNLSPDQNAVSRGIAATSSTNAWAVGDLMNPNGQDITLIQHWDGTSWTVVSSPNTSEPNNILVSAAATSATDAWAVGFTLSISPLRIGNLIEH